MAKNDVVLIDALIDDKLSNSKSTSARGEVFELFVFEQLLKFADLSQDEINSGWTDGGEDGGIDGFFIFVNDHFLNDCESFPWPKGKAEISVWVVTCKHADTFTQAPIDKLVATISDLFDFAKHPTEIDSRYSAELLSARQKLLFAYKNIATRLVNFSIRIIYASRGDVRFIGKEVSARASQVKDVVLDLFSKCDVEFKFIGAAELVELERRSRRYSLELPFRECLDKDDQFVILSGLSDYMRFVTDEDGSLRRYLFESNVRDFVGLNRVNEDIAISLSEPSDSDFWWLNNGVTILCANAIRTAKSVTMDDVQIVNGLQTTVSIARHFSAGGSDDRDRSILVKIIKTSDHAIRDSIIRATNNQTEVEQQSLHATEKVQRDIESVLLRAGWHYDRRKNYYLNQGVSKVSIVAPLYAAAAFIALVKKDPQRASKLKQKFMRVHESYSQVFSSEGSLEIWPQIISIIKKVEQRLVFYRTLSPVDKGERFLRRWRYLLAFIVVARIFGRFSFTEKDILKIIVSDISDDQIDETWESINAQVGSEDRYVKNLPPALVDSILYGVASVFDIKHVELLARLKREKHAVDVVPVTEDEVSLVDSNLPSQPWKPGVIARTAKATGLSFPQVVACVKELVDSGRRYAQSNGKVYDSTGKLIAVDPDRVPPWERA